jgi:hypothetical protein
MDIFTFHHHPQWIFSHLDVQLRNSKFTNVFEKSLLSGFYYSFSGKVLILGNANVGKTCITRILIGKKPKRSGMPKIYDCIEYDVAVIVQILALA